MKKDILHFVTIESELKNMITQLEIIGYSMVIGQTTVSPSQ